MCGNAVIATGQLADKQLDRLQVLLAKAAGCESPLCVQYCLKRGGRNVTERCEKVWDATARHLLDLCVDFSGGTNC